MTNEDNFPGVEGWGDLPENDFCGVEGLADFLNKEPIVEFIQYWDGPNFKFYLNKKKLFEFMGLNPDKDFEVIKMNQDDDYPNTLILELQSTDNCGLFKEKNDIN